MSLPLLTIVRKLILVIWKKLIFELAYFSNNLYKFINIIKLFSISSTIKFFSTTTYNAFTQ